MWTLRYSALLLLLFHGKENPHLAYVFQHGAGPFRALPMLEIHIVDTYTSQVFRNLEQIFACLVSCSWLFSFGGGFNQHHLLHLVLQSLVPEQMLVMYSCFSVLS